MITERQPDQNRHQGREVRADARRFGSDELRRVRVRLLGHHAGARRVAIIELGPSDRRIGQTCDVGTQTRQMRRQDRRHREELLNGIAVGYGV